MPTEKDEMKPEQIRFLTASRTAISSTVLEGQWYQDLNEASPKSATPAR
jgi:hypothetical protein